GFICQHRVPHSTSCATRWSASRASSLERRGVSSPERRTRLRQPANIFSPKLWLAPRGGGGHSGGGRNREKHPKGGAGTLRGGEPNRKKSHEGGAERAITVKALHNAGKAIEIDPKDAQAYVNRGVAYGAKGEYD